MLDYLEFSTDKQTYKGEFPNQVLYKFEKVQDVINDHSY